MSEVVSGARLFGARAVAVVHVGVIAFFSLGWLLPDSRALWAVLLGCIGLEGTWLALRGSCPLTLLERRLRGQPAHDASVAGAHRSFVGGALEHALKRPVSERCANRLVHGVTFASAGLAALHLGLR